MKKIFFPLVAIFIGVAVSIGIAEAVARGFGLSKTWESYIDRKKLMQQVNTSKTVGYTRFPNASFISARHVVFDINNYGFRDRNWKPATKKKRIAFIGDSVTEGFGVDTASRFSNLLGQHLNETTNGFEIQNFGVSGHGTCDEFEILNSHVFQFKPSIVFLQVCFNDFKRNSKYEAVAAAHNMTDTLDITMQDAVSPNIEMERSLEAKDPESSIGFKSFLQKNSAFYLFLAERYAYIKLLNNVPNSISPSEQSTTQHQWNTMMNYLSAMDSLCNANNAEFKVIYVPLEVEVMIKDDALGTIVNNHLDSLCALSSVDFINTIEDLRSEKDKTTLYLDDCHLSVRGNRSVAMSIIKALGH